MRLRTTARPDGLAVGNGVERLEQAGQIVEDERADQQEAAAQARSARIEALNRRFRMPLTRFFSSRTRSPDDIEDLVQEVFMRLVARGGLEDVRAEENYLFVIASNVWRDSGRRDISRHRGGHATLTDQHHPVDPLSPEVVALAREDLRRVLVAIQELPLRTQAIFALQRYEELSYAEIARRQGISVSAVEKHMMKAIAHLARRAF